MKTTVRSVRGNGNIRQPIPPKPSGMTQDQYNLFAGSIASGGGALNQFGQSIGNSVTGGVSIGERATDILTPLSKITTSLSSSQTWLNIGFIVVGIILIFISVQFILQGELSNLAGKVVGKK